MNEPYVKYDDIRKKATMSVFKTQNHRHIPGSAISKRVYPIYSLYVHNSMQIQSWLYDFYNPIIVSIALTLSRTEAAEWQRTKKKNWKKNRTTMKWFFFCGRLHFTKPAIVFLFFSFQDFFFFQFSAQKPINRVIAGVW